MKLRYKIISCSSEDVKHPISNLILNSGFWESIRFCDYPQQITLQFYQPITIRQLSIVSHPIKIASRISILFCLPDREKPGQGFRFEKYGYVQLCDNSATDYKCRQCKKITDMQQNALYMRLIFWKNHQNPHNFFNQIGLSQLTIIGSPYLGGSLPGLQNRSLLHSISALQYIEAKLQLLQQFKQEFTKQDDFESAKQIKQIIKAIKLQGNRIKQLEHEKKKTIAEQNYEKAKKIKEEMDLIKSDIQYLSNNFYDPKKKLIRPVLKDLKLKGKVDELMRQSSRHTSPSGSRANLFKQQLGTLAEQNQVQSNNQDEQEEEENSQMVNSRVSYDNRILPAILHKNKKDFKQLLKGNENLEDAAYEDNEFIENYTKHEDQEVAEQLNPADEANASIPIQIFGIQKIKKLYSKHWNHKLESINSLNQQTKNILKNSKNLDKNVYKAIVFIFNKCIKQGSYPILSTNLEIMNSLLQDSQKKNGIQLAELRAQIHNELEKSLNQMFMKMSENQKVKQSSQVALKNMSKNQLYGVPFMYQVIHRSYNNNALTHSAKIKKYKLGAIETMLLECGLGTKNGLPLGSIEFVSKAAEDPNGEVRKQATQLLKLMKEKGGGEKVVEIVKHRQSIKGSIVKQLEK